MPMYLLYLPKFNKFLSNNETLLPKLLIFNV